MKMIWDRRPAEIQVGGITVKARTGFTVAFQNSLIVRQMQGNNNEAARIEAAILDQQTTIAAAGFGELLPRVIRMEFRDLIVSVVWGVVTISNRQHIWHMIICRQDEFESVMRVVFRRQSDECIHVQVGEYDGSVYHS